LLNQISNPDLTKNNDPVLKPDFRFKSNKLKNPKIL
jgi:hypothetical protein